MVPNAEFVEQVKQQFPNQDHLLVVVSATCSRQQGTKQYSIAVPPQQ
jgi:hypothetical protein